MELWQEGTPYKRQDKKIGHKIIFKMDRMNIERDLILEIFIFKNKETRKE